VKSLDIKENERRNTIIFFLLAFVLLFALNSLTPYVNDDLSYKEVYGTGKPVESLADIASSLVRHYFLWGGRVVGIAFTQLFLFIQPKAVFNVCNSVEYLIFIWLIAHVAIRSHKPTTRDYVFVFSLSWLSYFSWGDDFLWLNGSCVYLWPTVFTLLYILKTEDFLRDEKDGSMHAILMFLLGLLAGWSTENAGAAAAFFSLGHILYGKFMRKNKIPAFLIAGFIGCTIGFLFLILAPGNYVRLDGVSMHGYEKINIIVTWISRFFIFLGVFAYCNIPLLILNAVLLKKGKNIKSWILETNVLVYVLALLAGHNSMILSPEYPPRAMITATSYFMIVLLKYIDYQKDSGVIDGVRRKAEIVFLAIMLISLPFTFQEDYRIMKGVNGIDSILEEARANGETDVRIDSPKASIWNIHSVISPGRHYLSSNPEQWFNRLLSERHGLSSVADGKI